MSLGKKGWKMFFWRMITFWILVIRKRGFRGDSRKMKELIGDVGI